jgi:hypothetical protein
MAILSIVYTHMIIGDPGWRLSRDVLKTSAAWDRIREYLRAFLEKHPGNTGSRSYAYLRDDELMKLQEREDEEIKELWAQFENLDINEETRSRKSEEIERKYAAMYEKWRIRKVSDLDKFIKMCMERHEREEIGTEIRCRIDWHNEPYPESERDRETKIYLIKRRQ